MLASSHLGTGAAASVLVENYVLPRVSGYIRSVISSVVLALCIIFFAGILSHIVFDAFRHEEYSSEWPWPLLIAESTATSLLIFVRNGRSKLSNLLICAGMSGAALPDLMTRFSWLTYPHDIIHFYHDGLPLGFEVPFSFQIGIALLAIIYVRYRLR